VKQESFFILTSLTWAVFSRALFQVAKRATAGNLGKTVGRLACELRHIFGLQVIGRPTSLDLSESENFSGLNRPFRHLK